MSVSIIDVVLMTPGPRGRTGLPTIIWGAPGTSKTSHIEQAVRRHGLNMETVILSLREPADVSGLPNVTPDGVVLEPPGWAKRLAAPIEQEKGKPLEPRGVLFLDELSCFVAGTLVHVSDKGTIKDVPIETVVPGDTVITRDYAFQQVTATMRRLRKETRKIYISGSNTPIECTPEHLFMVVDTGWIHAKTLCVGDRLLYGTDPAEILKIELCRYDNPITVYDLTVDKTECFYAGGVLVHNCAAPSVQAAALRVVAEGVVGDYALPPGVRILAAANPEDQAAGGWGLAAPMANRMIHVDWVPPSPDEWAAWIVGSADGKASDDAVPVFDMDVWDQVWAQVRAGFAAFIRRRGAETLLALPDNESARGRAWPSHRSWELAARAVAGCRTLGAGEDVVLKCLYGAVGTGAGKEIWAYLKEMDLPDPEQMLSGDVEIPTKRPDITYAALASVCAVAQLPHKQKNERVVQALECGSRVAAKHKDVAAACVKPLASATILQPLWTNPKLGDRVTKVFSGPLKDVVQVLRAK